MYHPVPVQPPLATNTDVDELQQALKEGVNVVKNSICKSLPDNCQLQGGKKRKRKRKKCSKKKTKKKLICYRGTKKNLKKLGKMTKRLNIRLTKCSKNRLKKWNKKKKKRKTKKRKY